MRINDSALTHGITVEEINAIAAYPEINVSLNARRPGSKPLLKVGAIDPNEPYIEVIIDTTNDEVFHAMMLRMSTVQVAGIAAYIDLDRIAGRQRQ